MMRKTSLDKRLENAMDAFFQPEPNVDRFEMEYAGQMAITLNDDPTFSEKAEKWSGTIRSILLFGPGTVALFFLTLAFVLLYPTLGFKVMGLCMLAGAAFLVYAGAGSIRNVRNLAIPASIVALALLYSFAALSILGLGATDSLFYSIYLLPIIFVVGKITQALMAREDP